LYSLDSEVYGHGWGVSAKADMSYSS